MESEAWAQEENDNEQVHGETWQHPSKPYKMDKSWRPRRPSESGRAEIGQLKWESNLVISTEKELVHPTAPVAYVALKELVIHLTRDCSSAGALREKLIPGYPFWNSSRRKLRNTRNRKSADFSRRWLSVKWARYVSHARRRSVWTLSWLDMCYMCDMWLST